MNDQSVEEWARTAHFGDPVRFGDVEAGILFRRPASSASLGEYEQAFDVPQSYRFSHLVAWMSSPGWASSFGALQELECDVELERCQAEVVPAPGEGVTQFVEASYRASSIEGLPPVVRVDLQYPVTE